MSQIAIIDPSTDPRWDPFVENHVFGQIGHLSGWKQVVEASFPHIKGHCLALVDDDGSRIRAGLPVYFVRSVLTGRRIVSIPFATLSDPLVSSPQDLRCLLAAVTDLASSLRASRVEIKALSSNGLWDDVQGYARFDHFRHHFLPLDGAPDSLMRRFHPTAVRQLVKRCEKSGLELRTDNSYEALKDFFNAYLSTRKRLGLPPQPFRFFGNLWKMFSSSGRLRILAATYKGKTAASFLLFRFRDRISWEYVGEHIEYRYLHPTHFLLWQAIKQACVEGYKIFDFGRTSINNKGLMDFKRRWGTIVTDLPQFCRGAGAGLYLGNTESSCGYQVIREITRRVPKPVAVFLGKLCYQHMG